MEPEAVLGVAAAAAAGAPPPLYVPVGQPMFAAATVCAADDRDFIRSLLPLGVGYESDPELALSLQAAANLGEAASAAAARTGPQLRLRFLGKLVGCGTARLRFLIPKHWFLIQAKFDVT